MAKRKISSRNVSEKFDKLVAPIENTSLRVSAGRESQIGEFYYLNTNSLIPYPHQARKSFDPAKIAELAKTIALHGVRQPLTVEKSKEQLGQYYVVSGERRLRAAKSINLEKVPCIILNENDSSEEIAIIENIQRSDLHPIELASCYEKILTNGKHGDKRNLSERLGVAPTTISEHLKYNTLPEEIKSVLIKKNISSRSILRRLLKCTDEASMMRMLGISAGEKRIDKKKNIFNIYMQGGKIYYEIVKNKLNEVHKKEIEEIINTHIKKLFE